MSKTTVDLIEASPLPPLSGVEEVAERLVLAVHRGVDWSVWGGSRRARYWDALTERVATSCYAGPTIGHWYAQICREMTSAAPMSAEGRDELARLLADGRDRAVRSCLRQQAAVLVLRVRVLMDARRIERAEKEQERERISDDTAQLSI